MAENFYLILDGIQGDSTRVGVENSIECNALYHEIAQPKSESATGTSRTSSSVSHGVISVVKRIDRATPKLIEACNIGQVIASGRIELHGGVGVSDGGPVKYYEIELESVLVTGVRTEQLNNLFPESDETPVIERVSLAYNRIEWTFYRRDQNGSLQSEIKTNFDLATNTKT